MGSPSEWPFFREDDEDTRRWVKPRFFDAALPPLTSDVSGAPPGSLDATVQAKRSPAVPALLRSGVELPRRCSPLVVCGCVSAFGLWALAIVSMWRAL